MAFKMTPGIKGNPSMNRIKNLGGCGGPGQPPCPPRFQQEKTAKLAADRSATSRSKSIKPVKKAVVAPPKPPKPVKLQINVPKGYDFKDRLAEKMFYSMFEDAIEKGKYETQEQLDMAIMKQLKGTIDGPKDPKDPGKPVIVNPDNPGKLEPIPIKGGGEFEAALVKKANVAVAK
jgi:hypothetical protein